MMTFEQFRDLMNRIPKDIETITLSGGEPFMNPDLPKMCEACHQIIGIKPNIVTSGHNITYETIMKLEGNVGGVIVTIKYPDEVADSMWKGQKETLKSAMNTLDTLKKMKINCAINWVLGNNNKNYLKEMIDIAHKYDCHLNIMRYIPYSTDFSHHGMTDLQWEEVIEYANKEYSSTINVQFPSRVSYQLCSGGYHRLYINVNGDVTPCIYSHTVLGNIFNESLKDIIEKGRNWRDKRAFSNSIISKIWKLISSHGFTRYGCIALQEEGK